MSTEQERFDALWEGFKERVIAARTRKDEHIRTMRGLPFAGTDGGSIITGSPHEYDGEQFCLLHVSRKMCDVFVECTKQDLLNIAAHCVARAESFEKP